MNSESKYNDSHNTTSTSAIANKPINASDNTVNIETTALNLRWSFGFNSPILNSVHSLSTTTNTGTGNRSALFYLSGHTGVIHDLTYDTQYLLQGHSHSISAVTISTDKRWIVTADSPNINNTASTSSGDSMIVIWDSLKASPVKIIPQPAANNSAGIISMDLSADSMFLAVLTRPINNNQTDTANSGTTIQYISIYEWPTSNPSPIVTGIINNSTINDYHHGIRFNPIDVRDLITNSQSNVIFWSWQSNSSISNHSNSSIIGNNNNNISTGTVGELLLPNHPIKGISKLRKTLKSLTESTFIPYTTKAVTATNSGHIVAWDYPISDSHSNNGNNPNNNNNNSNGRDAIKILKLVKCGINLLNTISEKYLVCGCADGAVRFFDFQFRVVAWFEDIQAGPIKSLSFADNNTGANTAGNNNNNKSATTNNNTNNDPLSLSMEEFNVPNFIVSTGSGRIIELNAHCMDELSIDKRRGKLLIQGFNSSITSLDSHPHLPLFSVSTNEGHLSIWDIDDRIILAQRQFIINETAKLGSNSSNNNNQQQQSGNSRANTSNSTNPPGSTSSSNKVDRDIIVNNSTTITSIKFSPNGLLLAIGFDNGFIKLVSAAESNIINPSSGNSNSQLTDICNFHYQTAAIRHISWSNDNEYFALADSENCIGLYRYYHRNEEFDKPFEWIYIGKYRAHYTNQSIIQLYFNEINNNNTANNNSNNSSNNNTNTKYLYSIGSDKKFQIFNIQLASIRSGLVLDNTLTIEQTGEPLSMIKYNNKYCIISNNEYKLKLFNIQTKQTEKTVLAPTYGEPIKQLILLPGAANNPNQYLLYNTGNELVGLIKFPLDGNPNNSMALLAHPGLITSMSCSSDGKYLLTASNSSIDRNINLWAINTPAFEAAILLTKTNNNNNSNTINNNIQPYIDLIPGGVSGEFYQSLLDYFYYSQLKSGSLNTTNERQASINSKINFTAAIEMMRALGFYPTQKQIQDIKMEIELQANKSNNNTNSSSNSSIDELEVNLSEFIQLYINHRPVKEIELSQLEEIFKSISQPNNENENQDSNGDDSDSAVTTGSIDSEELIQHLLHRGEKFSKKELLTALKSLCNSNSTDSDKFDLTHRPDLTGSMNSIMKLLPQNLDAKKFAQEILGFN